MSVCRGYGARHSNVVGVSSDRRVELRFFGVDFEVLVGLETVDLELEHLVALLVSTRDFASGLVNIH